MFARLPLYLRLVRMDKPIGSLLLLWPTRPAALDRLPEADPTGTARARVCRLPS